MADKKIMTYNGLSYLADNEAGRLSLIIEKATAMRDLVIAQRQFFDAMAEIEDHNSMFGHDLDNI